MIFTQSFQREFSKNAWGVLLALLAILLIFQLVKTLEDINITDNDSLVIIVQIGTSILALLPEALALTVFISVLIALSRSYRDSEMVIWLASGYALQQLIWPVVRFALPILILVALLSHFVTPWALRQNDEFLTQSTSHNDLLRIKAGQFGTLGQNSSVAYYESLTENKQRPEINNIFLSERRNGQIKIVTAELGYPELNDDRDNWFVLKNGQKVQINPGESFAVVHSFATLRIRDKQNPTPLNPQNHNLAQKYAATIYTTDHPHYHAELHKRLSLPITVLVLALLAIPLAHYNPRAGRSSNLVVAILIYAIYNKLLSSVRNLIANDTLPIEIGWWLIHALILVIALLPYLNHYRIQWQYRQRAQTLKPATASLPIEN